ncbi:MAG: DmsC/YnfH family molybdoenzyme membrane anchor subunit [Dehalococcoidales bacterium]
MATMQVHEWMIKYTRQTEWIDRRGLFLWLAFYAGGLGGGLYLVSLFFNSLWGMLIGWLIVAGIKGGAHLIFLGRPLRAWRIVFRPGSSWLSRGILFVLTFALFGAIQMALTRWAPGSAAEIVFKVLAGAAALAVATYTGFVLNSVKAVPFWNSRLLPVLFILCGILGGFGLSVVIALNGGGINLETAETGARWLLIINAFLIGIYLWMAANREITGKKSVLEQIRGHLAPFFWIGIVILGIVVPLGVALISHLTANVSASLILTGVACEIIGGLTLRYCVLKAGAYKPLVARPS